MTEKKSFLDTDALQEAVDILEGKIFHVAPTAESKSSHGEANDRSSHQAEARPSTRKQKQAPRYVSKRITEVYDDDDDTDDTGNAEPSGTGHAGTAPGGAPAKDDKPDSGK